MILSILIDHRHILIEHLEQFFEWLLGVFIMQSLFSKDARVIKCPIVTHTSLQETNNSLPIVGDSYSRRRTRHAFASLIMPIEPFHPPSYWYNLSSNNDGSLCKLLLLE